MDYTQITHAEQTDMLATIGAGSLDELFDAIPSPLRFRGELDLPPARSELELQRELNEIATHNHGAHDMVCFMGGGAYDHFCPALVDQLILRGEFLTAYTPYQAEASQGSLQAFFEFQTQVARMCALDIANIRDVLFPPGSFPPPLPRSFTLAAARDGPAERASFSPLRPAPT